MMDERTVAQDALFYSFNLKRHVPADHMLRSIDRFVDLSALREHLRPYYGETGRPSIDPELLIRMLIISYCMVIECRAVGLKAGYHPNDGRPHALPRHRPREDDRPRATRWGQGRRRREVDKNAAFFDRPDQSATRLAHDARTHYVTIEMDGRVRSLVIAEPANDQALSDLVRIVRQLVSEDPPRRDGI